MSGYLGSIGFGFPAAMGAWAAVGDASRRTNPRKIVSVSGDGGFGQYLAEFTTAVKYGMDICHILLNNEELGKISKEQRAGRFPVWQTGLHNPNFAEFAQLCGGVGIRVTKAEELAEAIQEGLTAKGPAIVEILTDPAQT
jgi:thiamine pyrophosphate-dependent acetolactate synthase large subunit-like protein